MRDYYEALYKENSAYWGMLPSPVALLVLAHSRGPVLDLGCGQGPDALFFAKKGLAVTAIDISTTAITDLLRHAQELKLQIEAREQDMRDLPVQEFNIVFSRMALQMIPPAERAGYIASLKQQYPDAVHAHIIPVSGACFGAEFICENDLLKKGYADWTILFYEDAWTISRVRNKNGEPFLMREARVIARR
jgi:SAM-dependent methyltransferase